MIKSYLPELTHSEIFITMASGFASVSGSVLGAYIALGIDPVHLITSTIISGSGTIIISKIICPEVDKPKTLVWINTHNDSDSCRYNATTTTTTTTTTLFVWSKLNYSVGPCLSRFGKSGMRKYLGFYRARRQNRLVTRDKRHGHADCDAILSRCQQQVSDSGLKLSITLLLALLVAFFLYLELMAFHYRPYLATSYLPWRSC